MNVGDELELRKFVAPEFIFGADARRLVGRYAENFAVRKVLVITDPGVIEAGWTDEVTSDLRLAGIPYVVFSDVTANPRADQVMAGADVFKHEHCDALISIGGGSPIDCAKGIGIVSLNGGHILDYEGVDKIEIPMCPLICIPTTGGSSADVSQFVIITDNVKKVKIAIVSKAVVPDVSLIDPVTLTTLSEKLSADSGFDAFVHGIEAYVSNAHSPITDLFALESIRLLVKYLRASIDDPKNVIIRGKVMLGSLDAGLAFSNASLGLTHSMSHSVGGMLDKLHGSLNAALLSHVIKFNFAVVSERYRSIGEAMGIKTNGMSDSELEMALLDNIAQLFESLGMKATLGEMGIKFDDIPSLATKAMDDCCIATNPRKLSRHDLEVLFEEAL